MKEWIATVTTKDSTYVATFTTQAEAISWACQFAGQEISYSIRKKLYK